MVDAVRTYETTTLERVVLAVFGPQAERAFYAALGRDG